MPWIHSTAGRHAADRDRERRQVAEALDLFHDEARTAFSRSLKARGIRVQDVLGDEPELHAYCGLDHIERDSALIDATITEHGFLLDPARCSYFRDIYETVRLRNPLTGARLVVVIHRAGLLSRPAEAA